MTPETGGLAPTASTGRGRLGRAVTEPPPPSTIIIGGGLFGLTLGYRLMRRGEDVTVLEGEDRAGGNVRTLRREGFLLEAGPNTFMDRDPSLRTLAEELGLGPRLRKSAAAAKRRFLYLDGVLHEAPSSPQGLLTSRMLPFWSKLRVLAEPLTFKRARDDESLASFGRRHVGRVATERILDAVQLGIYAGDPERLSVRAAFPRIWTLEREHRSLMLAALRARGAQKALPSRTGTDAIFTFDEGLQTLTDALAEKLGPRLRLNARVSSVEPLPKGTSSLPKRHSEPGAPAVRVRHTLGLTEAQRVVLALPSNAAARLTRDHLPALATALEAQTYAPLAVVHLGYLGLTAPPQGFGVLIPHRERLPLLGVLYISSAFPFRAPEGGTLLTCMLGGARHPEVLALDDAQLLSLARTSVRKVLGIDTTPTLMELVRWAPGIPQYQMGHHEWLARVQSACPPGLLVGGNAYEGVGLVDCVRHANVLAERLVRGEPRSFAASSVSSPVA